MSDVKQIESEKPDRKSYWRYVISIRDRRVLEFIEAESQSSGMSVNRVVAGIVETEILRRIERRRGLKHASE